VETNVKSLKAESVFSAKRIATSPWEYSLYEVNDSEWILLAPYSIIGSVDVHMLFVLNPKEKERAKASTRYIWELSESVRNNPKTFLERDLSEEITKKIQKLANVRKDFPVNEEE